MRDDHKSEQKPDKERQDLKKRLKEYALRIIRLYEALPKQGAVHHISHQLLEAV